MNLKEKIAENPNTIFLVDGIGAMVSAISLAFVLTFYEEHIRMPFEYLYSLAFIAFILSFYSFFNYYFSQKLNRKALKFLIIGNISYTILTLIIVLYKFQELSNIGIAYFFIESSIITMLVILEMTIIEKTQINKTY